MKSTLQVLAIVATIVAISNGTKVQECDEAESPTASKLTVRLGDCDEGRCELQRGKTYNYLVKFKAPQDIDNLETTAIGYVYGYERTLESGVDKEACKSIRKVGKNNEKGKACPLKEGTHYVYEKPITISESEIKTKADVQWYMYSGEDTLFCFKLPVEIKAKE